MQWLNKVPSTHLTECYGMCLDLFKHQGVLFSSNLEQSTNKQESKESTRAKEKIAELEKSNEILRSVRVGSSKPASLTDVPRQYLQEFVGRVATRADKECKTQHHKACRVLLLYESLGKLNVLCPDGCHAARTAGLFSSAAGTHSFAFFLASVLLSSCSPFTQMECFVGGKLTTSESDEAIASVQRQLASARKK